MIKLPFYFLLLSLYLTACDNNRSSGTNPRPDGNEKILAKYKVETSDLSISLFDGERADIDQNAWDELRALLPNTLLKSTLGEYHTFTDGKDDTLAFVVQVDPVSEPEKWVYAIDRADSSDLKSESFVLTMLHEFAHLVALEGAPIDYG